MPSQEYRLDGLTIVITRAADQSAMVCDRIVTLGGYPCLLPALEIVPILSDETLRVFERLDEYDWLVFTSSNAVNHTFNLMRQIGIEPDSLDRRIQIAVVGAKTEASLAAKGLNARVVSKPANAMALLQQLRLEGVAGAKLLLPSSSIASAELAQGLIESGAMVRVVQVYDTRCPLTVPLREARQIRNGAVDVITFASPSAVNNFIQLVGSECLEDVGIACIGPTTAAAVETIGCVPSIVPEQASMENLLRAISCSLVAPELNGVEIS